MDAKIISNQEELNLILKQNFAALLYFSKQTCNVGEALTPKVFNMIKKKYSKISFYQVDMDHNIETTRAFNVVVEPTVILFFDEKETIRKSRIFSVSQLSDEIKRIYKIAFNS